MYQFTYVYSVRATLEVTNLLYKNIKKDKKKSDWKWAQGCKQASDKNWWMGLSVRLSDTHPDVFGVFSFCYPHHPQKLVNVVSRVADHAPKDDQDVVHVQWPHDAVGRALVRRHCFPHLKTGKKVRKLKKQLLLGFKLHPW